MWDDEDSDITADVEWRPSPRLKDALVADRVMEDEAGEEAARLLLNATYDTTLVEHLARQLGMTYCPRSAEDTLEFLLPELDNMLKTWPMTRDAATCKTLAHEATKYIYDVHELLAMLLVGPAAWKGAKISAPCRIDGLGRELQVVIENALTSSLVGMLQNWDDWKVNRLHERRRSAVQAQREVEAQAEMAARAATLASDAASATPATPIVRGSDGKPIPPPPHPREKRYVSYTRPGRS